MVKLPIRAFGVALLMGAQMVSPVWHANAASCNTNYCSEPLTSTVYVFDNQFGNPSGTFGTQSINVTSSSAWSTSWNFSGQGTYTIDSYAAAILGWQYGWVDSGTGLPVALTANNSIPTVEDYSVSSGTSVEDVSFDCWFDTTGNVTSSTPQSDEMMIWLYDTNLGPMTATYSNISIDGTNWDLYSDPSHGGWNYIQWAPHNGGLNFNIGNQSLNIADFTDAAIAYGALSSSHYLSSVEFGTEVYGNGASTLTVSDYSASVGSARVPPVGYITGASAGNGTVTLSWSPEACTSYSVYRGTSSGGESGTAIATGLTTTSYTNSGLTNGVKYYYKIKTVNGSGAAGYSNEVSATPSSGSDPAEYNFESSTQGFSIDGSLITGLAQSTAEAFAGTHSLAVTINGAAGNAYTQVLDPSAGDGKVITFHVWIPSGSQVTAIQPFEMDADYTWTGNYQTIGSLKTNAWNTLTVTVPSNAVLPLYSLGVQFFTGATWSGTCYVDSISW
jgi:hypothetical protein